MGKDLGTTAFATHDEEFNGNFRGQVMNNLDPLQAGRIQVQVLPMLVNVDSSLLPWAIPAMPLSSGASSNSGSFCVPNVGSFVWVFFERGSIYQPVYFAEAQDKTRGVPSFASINYPSTRGIETAGGIVVSIDDALGVVNVSGATIVNVLSGITNITSATVNIIGTSSVNINPV